MQSTWAGVDTLLDVANNIGFWIPTTEIAVLITELQNSTKVWGRMPMSKKNSAMWGDSAALAGHTVKLSDAERELADRIDDLAFAARSSQRSAPSGSGSVPAPARSTPARCGRST